MLVPTLITLTGMAALASASPTPDSKTLLNRQGTFIRYAGCFGSDFNWPINPSKYNLTIAYTGPANGLATCSAACPNSSHFILWDQNCFCAPLITIDKTRNYIPQLDQWEATEGDCWRTCANEPGISCGGSLRASFYQRTDPPSLANPGVAPVTGWHYMGCYSSYFRALPTVFRADDMTPTKCSQLCPLSNYFGVEYGRECWCGPALGTTYKTFNRLCGMVCKGDGKYLCGGNRHFTLYEKDGARRVDAPVGGYDFLGCYTDLVNNTRTLARVTRSDSMTLEVCEATAASQGAKFFGVEYGRECWTGNGLAAGSGSADDYPEICIQPCAGNPGQVCGGSKRLSLYVART
ncbi:WSC domain-containing protein [Podospora australis]|uniref:WSC domain-containing protein n=1 Tax=Podospora australis TaxID=1536484 RepID=A0AAN6WM52_9PEZI|nr:WSC domain-containing protein [Podospora australis]